MNIDLIIAELSTRTGEDHPEKLSVLAYYIQSWMLYIYRRTAFDNMIMIDNGQVSFSDLGDAPCSPEDIDDETDLVIDLVIEEYYELSLSELRDLIRSEFPYQNAVENNSVISRESMASFYDGDRTLVGFTSDQIKILGVDSLRGEYVDDFDLDEYLAEIGHDPVLDQSANLFVIPSASHQNREESR